MEELIKNICSVQYLPVSQIKTETISRNDFTVSYTLNAEWQDLPLSKNATIQVSSKRTADGWVYSVSLSSGVKSKLSIAEPILIRMELETETYIIGDKDLPVNLDQTDLKAGFSLSFSHDSWHAPYQLIDS